MGKDNLRRRRVIHNLGVNGRVNFAKVLSTGAWVTLESTRSGLVEQDH